MYQRAIPSAVITCIPPNTKPESKAYNKALLNIFFIDRRKAISSLNGVRTHIVNNENNGILFINYRFAASFADMSFTK